MPLSKEIKQKVIGTLKKYPDWIVRIECEGLGGQPCTIGGYWEEDFSVQNKNWRKSVIEDFVEYEEEIIKKIFAIERVFERMQKERKECIRLTYLVPDNSVFYIVKKVGISKSTYFRYIESSLISFARAFGYIK